MIPYWFTMKEYDPSKVENRSCPLCEMGHKPTLKMIVPVIILKKKYRTIIKYHRAIRRTMWTTI
jgi:hypothetical protein